MRLPIRFAAVLAILQCGTVSAQPGVESEQLRAGDFRIDARLERTPTVLESPAHVLRATLSPRAAASEQGTANLLLKARLSLQGTPICVAPGRIFGDGFEQP